MVRQANSSQLVKSHKKGAVAFPASGLALVCFISVVMAACAVIGGWRQQVGGPSRSGRWQETAKSQSRNFADLIFMMKAPAPAGALQFVGLVRSKPITGEARGLALARPLLPVWPSFSSHAKSASRRAPSPVLASSLSNPN